MSALQFFQRIDHTQKKRYLHMKKKMLTHEKIEKKMLTHEKIEKKMNENLLSRRRW